MTETQKPVINQTDRMMGIALREIRRLTRSTKKTTDEREEQSHALSEALTQAGISQDMKTAQYFHYCRKKTNNIVQISNLEVHYRRPQRSTLLFAEIHANTSCNKCGGTGKIWTGGGGSWSAKQ